MSNMTPGGSVPPPAGGAGGEIIRPSVPPKDPILVAVLNLLVAGGVGYIILGQKTKGIVAIVVWVLGLIACGIPSALVAIAGAVDGYMQAQLLQQGKSIGQWTWFQQGV